MSLIFYKFYYYLFLFVLYYRAVFLIRNSRLKKIINTQLTTDVKRIMTVGCSLGSNTDAVLSSPPCGGQSQVCARGAHLIGLHSTRRPDAPPSYRFYRWVESFIHQPGRDRLDWGIRLELKWTGRGCKWRLAVVKSGHGVTPCFLALFAAVDSCIDEGTHWCVRC